MDAVESFIQDVNHYIRRQLDLERYQRIKEELSQQSKQPSELQQSKQPDGILYHNVTTGEKEEISVQECMSRLEKTIRSVNTI